MPPCLYACAAARGWGVCGARMGACVAIEAPRMHGRGHVHVHGTGTRTPSYSSYTRRRARSAAERSPWNKASWNSSVDRARGIQMWKGRSLRQPDCKQIPNYGGGRSYLRRAADTYVVPVSLRPDAFADSDATASGGGGGGGGGGGSGGSSGARVAAASASTATARSAAPTAESPLSPPDARLLNRSNEFVVCTGAAAPTLGACPVVGVCPPSPAPLPSLPSRASLPSVSRCGREPFCCVAVCADRHDFAAGGGWREVSRAPRALPTAVSRGAIASPRADCCRRPPVLMPRRALCSLPPSLLTLSSLRAPPPTPLLTPSPLALP